MNHTGPYGTPIELQSGTVHRLLADLVRLGLWVEQQGELTRDRARRHRLHLTHLSCRLTVELVSENLTAPHVVRPVCRCAESPNQPCSP